MAKCISPIKLKKQEISVPCGKCLPCMKNRASNWSFRLNQEAKRATTAYFITLTYDTQNVQITKNGFMTLHKPDFQAFMKKLRKLNKNKLTYYAVGEYGGKFNRPHFHVIMFNLDLATLIPTLAKYFQRGVLPMDGTINCDSPIWDKGHVTVGQVNEKSIGYTLIYISKGGEVPKHQRDDRVKEFSLMSKRIGDNYINQNVKQWHKADLLNRYYVPIHTSKGLAKAPLPRYYKQKLYTDWQRLKIGYHLQNQADKEYEKLTYQQKQDLEKQETSKKVRLDYRKQNKK